MYVTVRACDKPCLDASGCRRAIDISNNTDDGNGAATTMADVESPILVPSSATTNPPTEKGSDFVLSGLGLLGGMATITPTRT